LRAVARPRASLAPLDLRPAFAAAALAGFVFPFLVIPLVERARRTRRSGFAKLQRRAM
jgi:mxaL protein